MDTEELGELLGGQGTLCPPLVPTLVYTDYLYSLSCFWLQFVYSVSNFYQIITSYTEHGSVWTNSLQKFLICCGVMMARKKLLSNRACLGQLKFHYKPQTDTTLFVTCADVTPYYNVLVYVSQLIINIKIVLLHNVLQFLNL